MPRFFLIPRRVGNFPRCRFVLEIRGRNLFERPKLAHFFPGTPKWRNFRSPANFPIFGILYTGTSTDAIRRFPKTIARICSDRRRRSLTAMSRPMVSYGDFRILNLSQWGLDSGHFVYMKLAGGRWYTTGAQHSCVSRRFRHSSLAALSILWSQRRNPKFPEHSVANR